MISMPAVGIIRALPSPLRGLAEPATRLHSKIERPKKNQPCRVEVLLLVEAAGTVLRL
jgi:hypothetical protein